MTRKLLVAALVLVSATASVMMAQATRTADAASVDVWKSPTCGCCAKWIDHMRKAGFTVNVTELEEPELQKIKTQHGVPTAARSCHTARVAGYTVEGHVPAPEVKRLLSEQPKVAGIAVPGMPLGSPGMEVSGVKPQPYEVVSFDKSGATRVFSVQKP